MIRASNLKFSYGSHPVFQDLSFELPERGITAIIGANGSGKSTLANLLAGLVFPKSGEIYLDDLKLARRTDVKLVHRKIGLVFQNPAVQIIFPKVADDIRFTLENLGTPPAEIANRIARSLEKVGMSGFENANPYELSGGQKQRIALASQLALEPAYLILDEATSMLDPSGRAAVHHIMKTLGSSIGVIFITNSHSELRLADRVLELKDGKLC